LSRIRPRPPPEKNIQNRVIVLTQNVSAAVSNVTLRYWQGTPAALLQGMETRRRTQRFTLLQPVAARAGTQRARVVDVSINGIRLSHPNACPQTCSIVLDWPGAHIAFTAERKWMRMVRGEYHCGFEIQSIDAASTESLRRLLDEAHEPAYERHELVHGVWRKIVTTDARQPESGFTVRASESPHTIDFFRAAYFTGDRAMRDRIRWLATLSIAHPERHYDA